MVNPLVLQRRAALIRALRGYFDARQFIEVTTPVRIEAPAPETHIDCPRLPPAAATAGGRASDTVTFLRASPELQMKKLLAAGMDRIYQLGPCFREGEHGSRHRSEFTMLEWYRRDADYLKLADDLEGLIAALGAGVERAQRITVREAYLKYAGWDPWRDWDQDRFDFDMATKIEPSLPEGPVLLMDYPLAASSLAVVRGEVAERWEFYWHRIELANCFTELCDAVEQRRRFLAARVERRALGESDYPIDEEFLSSLPLIGSAAGVAVGVDRLVMLLCGESDIGSVMCEP